MIYKYIQCKFLLYWHWKFVPVNFPLNTLGIIPAVSTSIKTITCFESSSLAKCPIRFSHLRWEEMGYEKKGDEKNESDTYLEKMYDYPLYYNNSSCHYSTGENLPSWKIYFTSGACVFNVLFWMQMTVQQDVLFLIFCIIWVRPTMKHVNLSVSVHTCTIFR